MTSHCTAVWMPQLLLATVIGVAVLGLALWFGHLSDALLPGIALAMILAPAICGWRFHRRAGGITGDFLGATQQVTQLALLVVFAAALQ